MRCALAAVAIFSSVACGPKVESQTLVYDARFGDSTSLEVFRSGDAPGRPAIMLVHGGGWRRGSRSQLSGLSKRLASEGYVTASIDYRLDAAGAYPASSRDCRCALSYLQNHAEALGLDRARVAVLGYSAGGHLVSLLATASPAADCAEPPGPPPAAVIAGAAPEALELLAWANDVQHYLGAPLDGHEARYAEASPLSNVRPGLPPFLLIHGEADAYVPAVHALRMREALRASGNRADLLLLRGGGHVINPGVSADQLSYDSAAIESEESVLAIDAFLRETLGEPEGR